MVDSSEKNNTSELENNEEREEIMNFIRRNFPQIQMHGGDSDILEVDPDEGYVHIVLSGACSGCGISPMTVQMMQKRMYQDIDFIENVDVDTGIDSLGSDSSTPVESFTDENKDNNSSVNAPF